MINLINYLEKVRLLIFCSLLFSCHSQSEKTGASFDISSQLPKTRCNEETKKAERDFKDGKLVYCYHIGHFSGWGYRSEKEMTDILKKYGISYQNRSSTDIIRDLDDEKKCYCTFMREKIDEKYGSHFIDSIVGVADEIWIKSRINEIFWYSECDVYPNYPGDTKVYPEEYSEVLSKEVASKLIYPKGFIKSSDLKSRSFVNIYFNVSKNGDAEIIIYDFHFDENLNEQYEEFLKKQIEKHIKKTGWRPAKMRNHYVNSRMVMRYYFE